MITGTSYFPSKAHAESYYTPYYAGFSDFNFNKIIKEKIQSGEIHIGKPPIKPGQTLFIQDNRYFIQETKK
jgi:hypothetical protein